MKDLHEPQSHAPIPEFRPEAGPRRRPRWRTRALVGLLGLTVGGYLISQFGPEIPQAPRSGAVAKMLIVAGTLRAGVQSDPIDPGIWGWINPERTTIVFNGPQFGDAELARFGEAAGRGPTRLRLLDTRVSESGLGALSGMTGTSSLLIGSQMAGLHGSKPKLGAVGLSRIAKMKGLNDLWILSMSIEGDGLRHLAGLSRLRQLRLSLSDVPDRALIGLADACPSLIELSLDDTGITDAGLKNLGRFDDLQVLSIARNTAITPRGLLALAGLKSLRSLDLTGIGLLEGDIAAFRAARPDVEVILGNRQVLAPKSPPNR